IDRRLQPRRVEDPDAETHEDRGWRLGIDEAAAGAIDQRSIQPGRTRGEVRELTVPLAPEHVSAIARRLAAHAGLELPAWVVEARAQSRMVALGIAAPD